MLCAGNGMHLQQVHLPASQPIDSVQDSAERVLSQDPAENARANKRIRAAADAPGMHTYLDSFDTFVA